MLKLTLDTSTDVVLLALSQKNRLIASIEILHKNNLSSILLLQIERILAENNLKIKDISAIFVGIGPGSYTGTRIAVATANSLSISCKIPLYSFESPLAFLPDKLPDGPFAFLVPAKHTPNFLLQGFIKSGKICPAISHHFFSNQDLFANLPQNCSLIAFQMPLELNPPENFSFYPAKPNLPLLICYLDTLTKSSPSPFKILYLHNP